MGINKLKAIKFTITKRIEELASALDVFCKPQAFTREELLKAVDNIVIPQASLGALDEQAGDVLVTELEQAALSFLLRDFFVLMQQSGLNHAQRALWGALAKTHFVTINREVNYSDISLEDSSTGAYVLVRLSRGEALGSLELIKKPSPKCIAVLLIAQTFDAGVLEQLKNKITGDPYESLTKGQILDIFHYSSPAPHQYLFSLLQPQMPRVQEALLVLKS